MAKIAPKIDKNSKIVLGVTAGAIGIFIIVLVVILVFHQVKNSQNQNKGNSIDYVPEIYYDPTIPSAENTLQLIEAGTATQYNEARWCIPTFYAYRLVRTSDGGYGNLSAWSPYPVVAGPTVVSPNSRISQNSSISCNIKLVNIGFKEEISLTSPYTYNVHRQVGGTNANPYSVGTIVGILLPSTTGFIDNDGKKVTYHTKYIDVYNPNSTSGGNPRCSNCNY